MPELMDLVAVWPALLPVLVIFGFAPGFCLRIIVLAFPREHPRRRELVAELYEVPYLRRPLWVATQLEVALFEGLGGRMRAIRSRRTRDSLVASSVERPIFASRGDLSRAGIHRALQAGITGTPAGGAESVVVSLGYEDDEDHGSVIVYTGHGGGDMSGRQVADQSFDDCGNAAMLTSCRTGRPVRVVRHGPFLSAALGRHVYRYDGLYDVAAAWLEEGRSGFSVCRFRLVQRK